MKTHQFRKSMWLMPLAGLAVIAAPIFTSDTQPASENRFIKEVKTKMKTRETEFPGDRLYLACDKPLYAPGDDIWFSVFVRNESDLLPSRKSDVVEAQLIGPKGNVEKEVKLIARNGVAAGDFALDPSLPGGLYKLRAFTQWMKNVSDTNRFEREFQVQDVVLPKLKMSLEFTKKAYGPGDEVIARIGIQTNENKPLAAQPVTLVCSVNGSSVNTCAGETAADGIQYLKFTLPRKLQKSDVLVNVMTGYNESTESISRAVPVVLNHLTLEFFPEGGDMVANHPSRIAFRATNEWGKPADVEGAIYNSRGSRVATFASRHQGMGSFPFVPLTGETYYAAITAPAGITGTFTLPETLHRGYAMQCVQSKDRISVTVQSTEETELSFIAQVRGIVYYSTVIHATKGENRFDFPTNNFPAGVAQLTLFDERNVPRCERLVFVNRDRQLNVSITTDKQQYLTREKVRVTVSARDEKGMPVPASISLRAVDDQLLSFADDKSGNILSQLLLESDLRQKVEDPSYYFRKNNAASEKALDHLLMTSGWRRFTWEELLDGKVPALIYKGEKAIIAGTVIDGRTGQPVAAKIRVPSAGEVVCGVDGSFSIGGIDLSQPVQFTVTADGYAQQFFWPEEYSDNVRIQLYDNKFRVMEKRIPAIMEFEAVAMSAAVADERQAVARPKRPVKKPLPKPAEQPPRQNRRAEMAADRMFEAGAPVHNIPRKAKYHRARVYASPVYRASESPTVRSDFRSLLYWNPVIEVGFSGKKTVEFYTSDQISSFRIIAEGISRDGMPGFSEALFFTQLPFTVQMKTPQQLVAGDKLSLNIVLKNNTSKPIGGLLSLSLPPALKMAGETPSVQTLMPGASKVVSMHCSVLPLAGVHTVEAGFNACGLSDALSQTLSVVHKGFPASLSFSSQDADREFVFETQSTVPGSMKIKVTAFPDVVSDLLTGVEGILQEPYGCFEQTSCTAYPNAMVLKYLKTTGSNNARLLAHAGGLLDRGYKRLTTFETSRNGYEWFGAVPAHEGLTAYGIMEFADMKRAGQVIDQQMFDRTMKWLLAKRDGQGGFQREQHALHDFGRISDEVMNAYIVYALADAGCREISKEFTTAFESALKGEDAYLIALMANAAYSLEEKTKAEQALRKLMKLRKPDGSFEGTTHSITYSQGKALQIETTALVLMAMLKNNSKDAEAIANCVRFIVSSRSGSGTFSSTQSTILALKSLSEYAAYSKRAATDGEMIVYFDGKIAGRLAFKAGDTGPLILDGLGQQFKTDGKHSIRVKFSGGHLPYSVAIDRHTLLPVSDTACALGLDVKIPRPAVSQGETVRMQVNLRNRKSHPVPSAVAVIGIPAGTAVQPWQLKELQEKKAFDYYEINGNSLFLYYRGIGPVAKTDINLDLKTDVSGTFGAPASCAYLYYTNEHKTWAPGVTVDIKK